MPALSKADATRAIAHPLRAELLDLLDGRVASPVELASQLGLVLGNVSYHVRELSKLGAIAPVRRRRVPGALQTYYTAVVRISVTQELLTPLR